MKAGLPATGTVPILRLRVASPVNRDSPLHALLVARSVIAAKYDLRKTLSVNHILQNRGLDVKHKSKI
jgi:hypothetical protein